jgi:pimeloyl-ACP methyl ester carboxylesterase
MALPQQQIGFCTSSDGARVAYATSGSGPPLVKVANWLSHLEFDWDSPVWRHWLRELSRDHTLVRYDERGCGLSDWAAEDYSLDAWVQDLEAVVDRLGLERFPLLGLSQGGPIAIAYAARHPDRVSRLLLYGSYARGRGHRNPSEREREEREVMLRMISVGWGQDHAAFRQVFTSLFIPGASPEQAHWFNELQRVSATPENAARIARTFDYLDVRELAPRLELPTLVLHATGDLRIPFAEGRLLASLIPGARFVPLESGNHILLEGEPAWRRFLREARTFLGVDPGAGESAPIPAMVRRQRVEALFDRAIDVPPQERPPLLSRECGGDSDLRREVEALLSFADRTGITARIAGVVADNRTRPPAVVPGQTISQYEVVEKLGRGGMGVVYKAMDRRLQRVVALKFLPSYLDADREVKLRFAREAQAIASLDHPNLCTIFEVGEAEDGQLFLVMPYYEGETLKRMIERGPLPLATALDYGGQLCAGLAHAHSAGVVHRDIKPANLVVTPEGRLMVLDFGIAKILDASLTRTGAVLGTLSYMSPEQACGEAVDPRSDLWSLGVVLYEMLTGRAPFTGESLEALFFGIQYRHPPGITGLRPEVPAALVAVVNRLLEKAPSRRYSDAAAVGAALEECRRQETG